MAAEATARMAAARATAARTAARTAATRAAVARVAAALPSAAPYATGTAAGAAARRRRGRRCCGRGRRGRRWRGRGRRRRRLRGRRRRRRRGGRWRRGRWPERRRTASPPEHAIWRSRLARARAMRDAACFATGPSSLARLSEECLHEHRRRLWRRKSLNEDCHKLGRNGGDKGWEAAGVEGGVGSILVSLLRSCSGPIGHAPESNGVPARLWPRGRGSGPPRDCHKKTSPTSRR